MGPFINPVKRDTASLHIKSYPPPFVTLDWCREVFQCSVALGISRRILALLPLVTSDGIYDRPLTFFASSVILVERRNGGRGGMSLQLRKNFSQHCKPLFMLMPCEYCFHRIGKSIKHTPPTATLCSAVSCVKFLRFWRISMECVFLNTYYLESAVDGIPSTTQR